jgi:hypothetical protein
LENGSISPLRTTRFHGFHVKNDSILVMALESLGIFEVVFSRREAVLNDLLGAGVRRPCRIWGIIASGGLGLIFRGLI